MIHDKMYVIALIDKIISTVCILKNSPLQLMDVPYLPITTKLRIGTLNKSAIAKQLIVTGNSLYIASLICKSIKNIYKFLISIFMKLIMW